MNGVFNCLISAYGLAYLTGAAIFLITLALTAKRFIGLGVAFIFLIFALAASQAVAHQDLIRQYFESFSKSSPTSSYKGETSKSDYAKEVNADLQKAFDDLKAEFLLEKDKLQKLYEQITSQNTQKKESEKEANDSKEKK